MGQNRILCGGSWNNGSDNCQVANRNINNPQNRNNNIGFRVAHSSQKGWMSVYEQIIIPSSDRNKYYFLSVGLVKQLKAQQIF